MISFCNLNRTTDLTICTCLFLTVLTGAQIHAINVSYTKSWGPDVGTDIPDFQALDQYGEPRTLSSLTGPNGLLLFFNRSADW